MFKIGVSTGELSKQIHTLRNLHFRFLKWSIP